MPPFRKPTLVTLRRQNPSQAWGFRLGGGAEIGQPFQIQKVTPESLAFLGGLSERDELVRIGNISLRGLTHDEVQQIILRCSLCIDLFVFRDNGADITPRFELLNKPEVFNKVEVFPRSTFYSSAPVSPTINHTPMFNSHQNELPIYETSIQSPNVDMRQDFNRSPRPFDSNASPTLSTSPNFAPQERPIQQLVMPVVETKPGSPVRDPRIFGMSGRGSKSPLRPPSVSRENSISPIPPPLVTSAPVPAPLPFSQSTPSTPAASKNLPFFSNDFNNNPMNGDKKVFGLPNRGGSRNIAPLGSHGVQPVDNERKYFGMNLKQRHNSFSCERHWKEPLAIISIPNTDQLLPSQTKQMQTYINQIPPTEKNLRPSLIGLERRRIRPVWPPPHPGRTHRSGICIEGRDSPNTKMFNWPPRAQSVDRDFSYGDGPARFATPPPGQRGQTPERCESPFYNGRVQGATKVWPPVSNATPAGASGFKGDEDENYAYNPNGDAHPSLVSSHIPRTYRPPPGTQHLLVNDF